MARKSTTRAASGSGTIRKKTVTRNGRQYEYWEARITTGRDPGSGKQIQRSFSGKTQKEVREKMQAAAVALNEGDYYEPSRMTFGQWLDVWLAEYQGDKKYYTTTHYGSQVRTHIKPGLGAVKLQELTAPQIQRFYNGLLKSGRLAPSSVKNLHACVVKALNVAVDVGYIKINPALKITLPRMEHTEITPLSDNQVTAFLKKVKEDKYSALLQMIVFTGMRESEALGLCWDCIDFNAGTVKVCKQLQKRAVRDGGTVFAPPKNDKPRTITAAPFVMRLLEQQRQDQIQQRFLAGEAWEGWQTEKERRAALVFTMENGRPITPQTLRKHFKKVAAEIGAPDCRVHDLRHTFAVLSLQNGDDIKTVQENLGHATAAFTLDVYGHVSETMKVASAARMESYIKVASEG